MPTSYQIADDDVLRLTARVMKQCHPRLHEAGIKVGILFASNPDGDAVTHGGYPALAKIKPVPLKDRVSKEWDAEMVIDESAYRALREEQREALLDHELSHITTIEMKPTELKAARAYDPEAPSWKLDDLGRPKLRSVKGDWNVGDGFGQVVARHGEMAIEYENIRLAKGRADAARERGEQESADPTLSDIGRKFIDSIPEGMTVEVRAGGQG
jgi:hypothetical protein